MIAYESAKISELFFKEGRLIRSGPQALLIDEEKRQEHLES